MKTERFLNRKILSVKIYEKIVLLAAFLSHHVGLLLEECGSSRRWIDFSCRKFTKNWRNKLNFSTKKQRKEGKTQLESFSGGIMKGFCAL